MASSTEEKPPAAVTIPQEFSDLDLSFTSSTTSTSSFTTTTTTTTTSGNGACSARSSLSLNLNPNLPPSLHPLPHRRWDPHWSAVRAAALLSPTNTLLLRHLTLLRHLGSGNLARVFHCRLRGFDDPPLDFALKVVDLAASPPDDRIAHVQAEARALASLDHPFLPTLYARLDASHYACFLIDYCPAGDLHSLLLRRRRLPLPAARFYAAEVLLALQYLHALGFVYRDLKPENVLLRADGHVMLSDFDLSFHAPASPLLHRRLRPTPPCFPRRNHDVEFVAEPQSAFSRACVGTHEYLAPEIAAAAGHGSAVDWWAFGVFIHELIYGHTPFKGGTKEATLNNILTKELIFPDRGAGGRNAAAAKDLISRLLERDPRRRMGTVTGAAEIMRHPFFKGINWPLIRTLQPPAFEPHAGSERKRWWKWTPSSSSSCNSKSK